MADAARTSLLSPEAMGSFDAEGNYTPRTIVDDDLGGAELEQAMGDSIIEFEDGDEASDKTVQNYQKQLSETVRNAAQGLLLRTVKGPRIESVSVAEIRTEL